jgi:ATP-binding cassette subfamily B protein
LLWNTDRILLAGVIGSVAVQSILPAGQALVSRELINVVVAVLEPGGQPTQTLWFWVGVGMTLAILQASAGVANELWSQLLSSRLDLRLTTDILTHAASLDLPFFEDPRYQDMLERAQQSPSSHIFAFVHNALSAASNVAQAVSLIAILLVLEPLTGAVVVPIIVPYLISQWRLARTKYDVQHARATKRRWTRYFVGRLTNRGSIPEVKLLDLAPLLIANYRTLAQEFLAQDRSLLRRRFAGAILFVVASLGSLYLLFSRVITRVLAGALTLGDVGLYGGAMLRLRSALDAAVSSLSGSMAETLFAADLAEFLNTRPGILPEGGQVPAETHGEIRVEGLSFTYPGSSQPALMNVSLHIRPGETVALVGENGAGKTTLVKLLARLYEPDKGRILLDGRDLRDLSLSWLYSQTAFVFQDFNRYEATAADNISFGDWRAILHDRPAIEAIARRADAHDLITSLPQGYDTLLGRMFGKYDLSGGQWQKLAIARAAARPACLLILDEPTSNLDARAEYELFSRFRELARGRTTILISHRFTTVSMADRILVMAGGRIVEQGTHRQLLDQGGAYAALYKLHRMQTDMS